MSKLSRLGMKRTPKTTMMSLSSSLPYVMTLTIGVVIGISSRNLCNLSTVNQLWSAPLYPGNAETGRQLGANAGAGAGWPGADNSPRLFIFRRTKKTGSSSMLTALAEALNPLGYEGIYVPAETMNVHVRNEYKRPNPRRLLISEHNRVTKAFHPTRSAVIADTVRDGYEQMTSFCRYVKKVPTCDDRLIECLRSKGALGQQTYRWAGREEEDEDTYIDLPLSSAHPALSTTVFRTVFPNATLDIQAYNVANSTCPESRELRSVYQSLYQSLDRQVLVLRRRLLVIAGYPPKVPKSHSNYTTSDLLDAAEKMEREKYGDELSEETIATRKESIIHKNLRNVDFMVWDVSSDGSLRVKERSPLDEEEEENLDLEEF